MTQPAEIVIALIGGKGGVGKTTICVQLSAEFASRGLRVLLADADPQQTAMDWAAVAESKGNTIPSVIAVGDNLRTSLPSLSKSHDITLIDTAGRHSRRLAAALMIADMALIPVGASGLDVWALSSTFDTLAQARELRPDLAAAVVLNKANRTVVAKAALAALKDCEVPLCPVQLGTRTAYAESITQGEGLNTYEPRGAAMREVQQLADWLAHELGISIGQEQANAA